MVQLSVGYIIVVSLVALCTASEHESISQKNSENVKVVKQRFAKLLTSIAKINGKRLNALKEYANLEGYNIPNGILRTVSDQKKDSSVMGFVLLNDNSSDASNAFVQTFKTNKKLKKTSVRNIVKYINDNYADYLENYKDDEIKNENAIRNAAKESVSENTRKEIEAQDPKMNKSFLRWSYTCGRRSVRQCKKACQSSLNKVCREYDCTRSMKESFRKASIKYCKLAFN